MLVFSEHVSEKNFRSVPYLWWQWESLTLFWGIDIFLESILFILFFSLSELTLKGKRNSHLYSIGTHLCVMFTTTGCYNNFSTDQEFPFFSFWYCQEICYHNSLIILKKLVFQVITKECQFHLWRTNHIII